MKPRRKHSGYSQSKWGCCVCVYQTLNQAVTRTQNGGSSRSPTFFFVSKDFSGKSENDDVKVTYGQKVEV